MSFIKQGTKILSFADADDAEDRDQRIFTQNEGLTADLVETLLIRSTERVLSKIKATEWYKSHYTDLVPDVDPGLIKTRLNDFTDLTVYLGFAEYILPMFADFDSEDQSERNKMGYYTQKADNLFNEIISDGSWYDFNRDGSISSSEQTPGFINLKRVR